MAKQQRAPGGEHHHPESGERAVPAMSMDMVPEAGGKRAIIGSLMQALDALASGPTSVVPAGGPGTELVVLGART